MKKMAQFEPFSLPLLDSAEQVARATDFRDRLLSRRTLRHFSTTPVPLAAIEQAIATAASAPSGANRQPWRFVVVSSPDLKHQIRVAAEKEERENYGNRFPQDWLDALAPFGTDWQKPFLQTAPYLGIGAKDVSQKRV